MQTLINLAHAIAAELSERDTVHHWTASVDSRRIAVIGGTDEIAIDGTSTRVRFRPVVTADLARLYRADDNRPRNYSCFVSKGAQGIAQEIVTKVLPEYRQCKTVLMHRVDTEHAKVAARKNTARIIARATRGTLKEQGNRTEIWVGGTRADVVGEDMVCIQEIRCNAHTALHILSILVRE